jgi:DNA (cytosine-5)-methyltransferase 1
MKIADLFSGIGGMRLAVEQSAKELNINPKTIFSCDINKKSEETYKMNFCTDNFHGDIRLIPNNNLNNIIGMHDLLIAGFPCPPFSLAGVVKRNSLNQEHGFNDLAGNLFPDIINVLKKTRPRAFLLENVSHLKGHNKGETLKKMIKLLKNIDYFVPNPEILVASDFGLPQKRKRIFIVGFKKKSKFIYPKGLNTETKVGSILEKEIDNKYFISEKLWTSHIERKARNRSRGLGFGYSSVDKDSPYTRTLSARYYKDGSEILLKVPGHKTPRKLTPRECARLQGFPDSFKIHPSDNEAYRQFGNSVPVPVVSAVVTEIIKAIN